MSFTDQRRASAAETLGLCDPSDVPESPIVVHCPRSTTDRLRRRLHRLFDDLAEGDSGSETSLSRHEPEILTSVLLAMERPGGDARRPSTRRRRVALARARAYIEEHVRENVSILDLCREARVSLRTLEYAFLDHFGTPRAIS